MLKLIALVLALATAAAGCGPRAGTLEAANDGARRHEHDVHPVLGNGTLVPVRSGSKPNLPWPQFDVSSYTATVDYETPARASR